MHIHKKNRTVMLRSAAMLLIGASWPQSQAWADNVSTSCAATNFVPVTQCFRDTGAPGWILQRYSNNVADNTLEPLTAADSTNTGDAAGSGWLRLTSNVGNQSGSAYYNLPVNVTQLGIQVQFSYTAWGGSGADGIGFFLFDGWTTNFQQGTLGGGLGYCQQGTGTQSVNGYGSALGLSNAVLGFGIDDYSNFENNNDRCPNYGENGRLNTPNGAIGIRGPGNGELGYQWLADNTALGTGVSTWDKTNSTSRPAATQFYRNVIVNIAPATVSSTNTTYYINGSWLTSPTGTSYTSLIGPVLYPTVYPATVSGIPGSNKGNTDRLYSTKFSPGNVTIPSGLSDTWNPLPPTVKFGFFGSTGGSTNYHEIEDAHITEGLPDIVVSQTAGISGSTGTFMLTVSDYGSIPSGNTTFNAKVSTTLSGLGNIFWSCTPSVGSTCPSNGTGTLSNQSISLGLAGNVTFTIKGTVTGATISSTAKAVGNTDSTDMCTDNNTVTTSLDVANNTGLGHLNLSEVPQTTNSAADNTISGTRVQTTNQVYISNYHQANWWGELFAYNLAATGSGSSATLTGIASTANWNASCNLTGTTSCTSVTGTPSYTATTPSSRVIWSWNSTLNSGKGQGIALKWSNLSSNQQSALSNDPILSGSLSGSDVLNYLLGVRTQEQDNTTNLTTAGPFRTRSGILGDIVNSSPVWVGPPAPPAGATYPTSTPWSDLLYSSTIMQENAQTNSYATHQSTYAGRTNLVYVGSNDGMLHGFSAGNYASGSYNTSNTVNTGNELLAYVPTTILTQIAGNSATVYPTDYNFTDPSYTHHYFVDATPGSGDLYYAGAWHTWLVGGLGGGGQAIYALDITNPTNFTQANASTQVINELNVTNLKCTNAATGSTYTTCRNDIGWTYGTPIIQRMHDGLWAVIFGNGYNSTNEKASIFIATIGKTDGSWTVYELTTNQQTPNGIAYVTPADLDGDNVVDYLYAGDLFGNLWRFDVTSSSESSWAVSTYGGTSTNPLPLYSAVNQNGFVQPITTAPLVLKLTQTSTTRLVIGFGTGKNLETSDLLPDNTPGGVQSFYGIWDYNLSTWNANTNTTQKYMAQSSTVSINRTELQQQTSLTYDINGCLLTASTCSNGSAPGAAAYRTLSANAVCWQGSTTCNSITAYATGVNNQFGYFLDLPSTGEAVIYDPIQINGIPVFNTTIPSATTQGLTCYPPAPPGGWTMALNPYDGGALGAAFFVNNVSVNTSGAFANAVGSPSWVVFNNNNYLINKTASNSVVVQAINPAAPTPPTTSTIPTGHRVGWTQLR